MSQFVTLLLCVVLVVAILKTRRKSPAHPLRRLHAGVMNKAEWMAEDRVVDAVITDYLDAHHWMAEALFSGYVRFLHEAPLYLSGTFLKQQHDSVKTKIQQRSPRLIGVLRAHHHVRVRHFAEDGLSCLVIDSQSEQRMATYDYWEHQRLHTQDLGERTYVYRMVYDAKACRWKIEAFIQQLPMGWDASTSAIRLEDHLPEVSGRDL
jgi:hypothetical protein